MLSAAVFAPPFAPERIYAGQAGATHWPSGRRGKATLASRVGRDHLRGNIGTSTFRLTLASALFEPLDLKLIGPGRLARTSELRVSEWIRAHLAIAVHPFPDRDTLGALEQRIIQRLDPPLNLKSMPASPERLRLAELRLRLREGSRSG